GRRPCPAPQGAVATRLRGRRKLDGLPRPPRSRPHPRRGNRLRPASADHGVGGQEAVSPVGSDRLRLVAAFQPTCDGQRLEPKPQAKRTGFCQKNACFLSGAVTTIKLL